MTVEQAQREVSSQELSEWMAFSRIYPIGEFRADYRAASISAVIANTSRGKGQRAYEVKEFMPDWTGEQAEERERANVAGLQNMFKGDNDGG